MSFGSGYQPCSVPVPVPDHGAGRGSANTSVYVDRGSLLQLMRHAAVTRHSCQRTLARDRTRADAAQILRVPRRAARAGLQVCLQRVRSVMVNRPGNEHQGAGQSGERLLPRVRRRRVTRAEVNEPNGAVPGGRVSQDICGASVLKTWEFLEVHRWQVRSPVAPRRPREWWARAPPRRGRPARVGGPGHWQGCWPRPQPAAQCTPS